MKNLLKQSSSFLKLHDSHEYAASLQPLRIRATLSATILVDNGFSIASCAQTTDGDLQKRAVMLLRSDIFDCLGYYFHLQLAHERRDGAKYRFSCPASVKHRPAVRDPYSGTLEYFECQGELQISFSQANASATLIYEHIGHTESGKFRMTGEVRNYIASHKYLAPRQIYQNLIQMTNGLDFEKYEAHVVTRQHVYNFWLSLTKGDWQRDADDFKSAQLLVAEQDGYELVHGLQEPGISLAFLTPCSTDSQKFNRAKMTEIFIDSTFGTNRHGFELYCVLAEHDLVSLPLSYLLIDTRGIQEDGKRGSRLTQWFMALRNAGLKPTFIHTDKDFAEVTAASLAFGRNNSNCNHHLCLWHSLRAISQHISGKSEGRGGDSVDTVRASTRKAALPRYLHFLCDETEWILSRGLKKPCAADQANVLRTVIKRHLLRHPILPQVIVDIESVPESLRYQTYEEIHASSIKEVLEYCRLIDQPKLFRYFWCNWCRPSVGMYGRDGRSPICPAGRDRAQYGPNHVLRPLIMCCSMCPDLHMHRLDEATRTAESAQADNKACGKWRLLFIVSINQSLQMFLAAR
ncbi:hypothetical protein V1508DRAFT_59325 [Lipomyces doorenjongii]|uniref:uncharacterized protein n=1 Tax=Lipomyces doorenjongii TaxID=383834 RepID=UPI0034CD5680